MFDQKSGFSINQSRHRTHPFIYYNAHIKHYKLYYTTVSHKCVSAELRSYRQYNYRCLNSLKIQRILKSNHYSCCRVVLKAATFDLSFSLGKTVTPVITINNCHMNSIYFYIKTGRLKTINIYSIDPISCAIQLI